MKKIVMIGIVLSMITALVAEEELFSYKTAAQMQQVWKEFDKSNPKPEILIPDNGSMCFASGRLYSMIYRQFTPSDDAENIMIEYTGADTNAADSVISIQIRQDLQQPAAVFVVGKLNSSQPTTINLPLPAALKGQSYYILLLFNQPRQQLLSGAIRKIVPTSLKSDSQK